MESNIKTLVKKNLKKIQVAKQEIAKLTNSLIEQINMMHKKVIESLKLFESTLIQLLYKENLEDSEMVEKYEIFVDITKIEEFIRSFRIPEVEIYYVERDLRGKKFLRKNFIYGLKN